MDKFSKENILKLSKDLSINLSDQDIEYILKSAKSYELQIEAIKNFKIEKDVKPMHYPYDRICEYLRDDNHIHNLKKEEVLSMAPKNDDNYILINRIVK